ncbi:MAG: cytidylate kinase-like family protein [Firmicutes bacterium]|jgi:cytidylate kinase|nr:cytidylate kinase-like family protein [Bacillota bacterium]
MESFVITIARGYGSGGKTVAKALAKALDIKYYDRDLIRMVSEHSGINEALFNLADENHKNIPFRKYTSKEIASPSSNEFLSRENLFNLQAKIINDLAEKDESCIIVGRCAHHVLKEKKNVVKVFIHADLPQCIERVKEHDGVDDEEAKRLIEKTDRARAQYHKYYTNMEWNDARNYDLCLNTSRMTIEQCIKVIVEYLKIMEEIS